MKQGSKITLSVVGILLAILIASAAYSFYNARKLISATFPTAIIQSSNLTTTPFTHWHISFTAHDLDHTACVNVGGRIWYGAALTEEWLETHSNEDAAALEMGNRRRCVFTLGNDFNVVHRPTR